MKYNHEDIEKQFRHQGMKPSPTVHNSPEYKNVRKMFQGINSTTKGSVEKSKRRHNAKQLALNKKK